MGPEYVVISERMIQELVDRSANAGIKIDAVQLRPPFTAVNLRKGDPSVNYPLLAERVTEVLSDQTGSLEYPGEYIGLRAHFSGWLFSFEAERTPVVWLASLDEASLVVLCGSGRNVLGYDAPKQYPGWRPSSAGGLAEVVATLRKKDPKSLIGYQADERKQEEMADDAAWFTSGLMQHNPGPEIDEELDVLFKPYVYVEGFAGRYITGLELAYERVIIGAPLWARVASDASPPGEK
jgi:Family of unknown function (DUF7019)